MNSHDIPPKVYRKLLIRASWLKAEATISSDELSEIFLDDRELIKQMDKLGFIGKGRGKNRYFLSGAGKAIIKFLAQAYTTKELSNMIRELYHEEQAAKKDPSQRYDDVVR